MQKIYYSSVVSFDIFLLLLSIIIFAKPVVKSTPILCSQTKSWKLGGRDIVAESKGFVLLIVLMPLQCEHCHKQLMKFQTIVETLPEIRIVVVTPHDENPRLIERYRKEFPRIAIGMESSEEEVWSTLSGAAHDHFIYDRCGRLASIIRHPKSDTTKFEHTLLALKLAISYAQCGWCQYDSADRHASQKPIAPSHTSSTHSGNTKRPDINNKCFQRFQRIKAVMQPQSSKAYMVTLDRQSDISLRTNTIAPGRSGQIRTFDDYVSPLSAATPPLSNIENMQKTMVISSEPQQQQRILMNKQDLSQQQTQQKVIARPDNNISRESNWRASNGWTVSRMFPSRIDQSENEQRERQKQWKKEQQYQEQSRKKQELEHRKALERLRIQQEQQRLQHEEQQRRIQEQRQLQEMQRQREEQQHQEQRRFQQQELERRIAEQRKLHEQKGISDLYTDVSSEEQNSNDKSNWRQFKAPQYQQSVQNQAVQMTTFGPAQRRKSSSLYDSLDEEGHFDYSQAISETTATSTERTQIILSQRPEHSPFLFEHQVPCAAFTDEVCIEQKRRIGADKMSKCCDKGIYLTDLCVPGRCTNATTELCCMQKFLQASHRAKFHWLTAHEICLPNVRLDLSGLRFLINVASNENSNNGNNQKVDNLVTIDLNLDKSWDHSCEQGTKVLQFSYLPSDEFSDEKEAYENSEENR
uniref:SelP_N domain-containing protein n=1 Tax=Elaeophora elaphi TaxID=1147741 RepID=A0A0R3RU06_9BILA